MSELEFTAYHEAGHAVMAALLGGVVRAVTIVPPDDEGPNRFGDTQIEWPLAGISPRDQALREIKTALAGPTAEAVYRDDYDRLPINQESSADWLAASLHTSRLFGEQAVRLALLHQAAEQLLHLFRSDERIWSAVAAVADELLAHETLESGVVEELVAFWLR
jgi:ATP-dependent Zn protease